MVSPFLRITLRKSSYFGRRRVKALKRRTLVNVIVVVDLSLRIRDSCEVSLPVLALRVGRIAAAVLRNVTERVE
ncbi:MAG TPA: hypothetical protein VIK01_03360 [Polyangiaceae bacterium]